MAILEYVSSTSTTITVKITGLDDSYNNRQRTVYWDCSTAMISPASTKIANQIEETGNITLSGFSAGKTYTIKAKIMYYGYENGVEVEYSKTISCSAKTASAGTTRPSQFSWKYSTIQQGEDAIIDADDWNNLTANINAVRKYKDLSAYSFTEAVKGNNFTAIIYNQAVKAIKEISGYGTNLSEVSKGDTVTAKKLNDLVSEINSVP